ncbi:hypothetical protein IFT73_11480 [Aeromicrobium sp. CFBP 8757]|uniref:hypothetical protein n=1 Tax=Aeromicrobium sp. CFBP 8757 TaxID=2775288 RepID=UPI001784429A|nr:hypothetical protein [Aeromicrobium sp. CFBP 8757]MBD8607479.1 hypothetical protein [Aeromicrobium sp. CFBP 8757]
MLTTVLVAAVFVTVVVYIVIDIRRRTVRGGNGPRIGYIPEGLRPAVNRLSDRRGWPRPFDDEGRRIG